MKNCISAWFLLRFTFISSSSPPRWLKESLAGCERLRLHREEDTEKTSFRTRPSPLSPLDRKQTIANPFFFFKLISSGRERILRMVWGCFLPPCFQVRAHTRCTRTCAPRASFNPTLVLISQRWEDAAFRNAGPTRWSCYMLTVTLAFQISRRW